MAEFATDLAWMAQRWLGAFPALRRPQPGLSEREILEVEEQVGYPLHLDVRTWLSFSRDMGWAVFPYDGCVPLSAVEAIDLRYEVDAEAIDAYSMHRYVEDLRQDFRPVSKQHMPKQLFPILADSHHEAPLSVESSPESAGAVFVSGMAGAGWIAESMGHIFGRLRRLHEEGFMEVGKISFRSRLSEVSDLSHLRLLPGPERNAVLGLVEFGLLDIENASGDALYEQFAWTY